MNPRETESLIQAAHDGPLDEADDARLHQLLRESETARDLWCDYALLASDLKREVLSEARRPGAIPHSTTYRTIRQKRRQVTISLAAAAAVLLATGITLTTILVRPETASATFAVSPGTVVGGAPERNAPENEIQPGQQLAIRQGVVEFHFPNDVRAFLEGPAELRYVGPGLVDLSRGRARFHVPKKARGFTVRGPAFSVVDLGTEFGVDFRDPEFPSVAVIEGRVEVRAKAGRRDIVELAAGEAVELTAAGDFRTIDEPGDYPDSLPDRLPYLRLGFDGRAGDHFSIEGNLPEAGDLSARLVRHDSGSEALSIPGIHGSALRFDGGAELVTDWSGIGGDAPRTVHLWVRPAAGADYGSAPPLAFWGDPTNFGNRKFKLALVGLDDGSVVPRVSLGEWYANGDARLEPGRWHHLAAVWNDHRAGHPPHLTLYLDGTRIPLHGNGNPLEQATSTSTHGANSRPLSIGRYERVARSGPAGFKGDLDELHIIAGALEPEEIAAIARRP